MAKGSKNGFIGCLGRQRDLKEDALICYINKDLECFIIAENVIEFLENIESWKDNLIPYYKITFYKSTEEAEKN